MDNMYPMTPPVYMQCQVWMETFCDIVGSYQCELPPPEIPVTNCMTILTNGSYKMSSNFTNKAVSICIDIQASNVVFDCDGYWIDGVDGSSSKGFNLGTYKDNITIKNCYINDWYYGIYGVRNKNVQLLTNNVTSNYYMGLYMQYQHNNTAIGNRFLNNGNYVYYTYRNQSSFINNTIVSTSYGMGEIGGGGYANNRIIGNRINGTYALYMSGTNNNTYQDNYLYGTTGIIYVSGSTVYNTTIFNNWFSTPATNYMYMFNMAHSKPTFNTTLTSASNIMGGANIGGNYWTNPSKTGPSDKCADADQNGICDVAYSIKNAYGSNYYYDYLPISNVSNVYTASFSSLANNSYVGPYPQIIVNARATVGINTTSSTMWYKNSTIDWTEITNCTNQSINGVYNINLKCIWNNTETGTAGEGYDIQARIIDLSAHTLNITNHYYVDLSLPQTAYVDGDFPEYPYSRFNPQVSYPYTISNTLTKLSPASGTGVVSYYPFDTDTTTAIKDYIGTNDGTLTNGAFLTLAGKIGKGVGLDGVNDYINLGNSTQFDFTNNFTLSAWIKTNSTSYIIVKDPPLTQTYYISTTNCTPWVAGGCSSTDERGTASAGTLNCKYTDNLTSGYTATNVKVETYNKYLCSASVPLKFYWQNGVNMGNYSSGVCQCTANGAYPISYNINTASYNFGADNYFNITTAGGAWAGIMGGTAVGYPVGKIAKVTVTYTGGGKEVPYALGTNEARINNTIITITGATDNISQIGTELSFNFTINNCYQDLQNTTATDWLNLTCLSNNKMNQTRNYTTYDSNVCGTYENVTVIEYRQTEDCDFCTPSMAYTDWTAYINTTCTGQQRNQSSNRTYYDTNVCGEVENVTEFRTQLIDDYTCDTIAPAWTSLTNKTCYVNSSCTHQITATDYYGTINYALNATDVFGINILTGAIGNITSLTSINTYWFNASVNDSAGNYNYGIFWINITARPVSNVTGSSLCRYRKFGYWNNALNYYSEVGCI